ncbi:serine protease [Mesorhizobium sp. M0663]|uniref:serine protease n=1 Tax=unclassified Mesorhizobium TaxID=325217 RepID=UPI003339E6D2
MVSLFRTIIIAAIQLTVASTALADDFQRYVPGKTVTFEEFTQIVGEVKGLEALGFDTKNLSGTEIDPRIVGGKVTTVEQYPWQAALLYAMVPEPQRILRCGGSVIASNWILTAAHCVADKTEEDVVTKTTFYHALGIRTKSVQYFVHPSYDSSTYENDIALVKLAEPVADPTVVPLIEQSADIPDGTNVSVTGWGAVMEGGAASEVLRVADVPLVNLSDCNQPGSYNGRIKNTMMCAGYRDGGLDSCQGDSGGPAVATRGGKPVLVGIVSFGEGCARRLKYGVYTRVSAFSDWITQTMAAN